MSAWVEVAACEVIGRDLDERRFDVRARLERARASRHELAARRHVQNARGGAGNDVQALRRLVPVDAGNRSEQTLRVGCSGCSKMRSTGPTS